MKKVILFARKFLKALKVFISRVLADGGIIEAKNYVNSVLKTVGDASLVLIPSAYKSGVLYSILPEDGTGDFTASRNSVATRINPNGLIEEVGVNIPRIDYTDGTPVLLTEPQSTNLFIYSSKYDLFWQNVNSEIAESTILSPNGIDNMWLHTSTAVNGYLRQNGSMTAGNICTSIYVKKGNVDWQRVRTLNIDNEVDVWFDLANSAIGSWRLNNVLQNGDAPAKIEQLLNGVYRISVYSTSTTDLTYSMLFSACLSDLSNSLSGQTCYYWGGQCENLPYATSYIPTEGATATRLGETVTDAGDVNTFNSEEGVLFVETSALTQLPFQNMAITLSDETQQEQVALKFRSNGDLWMLSVVGGVNQGLFFYSGIDLKLSHKIAFKYKLNDFALWVDGVEVGTDTNGSVSAINTLYNLKLSDGLNDVEPFYGKTKQIQVFKTALTDAELIELTTL
ncbi:LamG domain-containing protein [Flavobacteriaceae bacterium]|nr:LamG domain-containing protein [Flavobacteriaceae bacterium]